MHETLKAAFTHSELELAATMGGNTSPLIDRVQQLFAELRDPLLSGRDVRELLACVEPQEQVDAVLKELCEKQILEFSQTTCRPLDVEQHVLFRDKNVGFTRLKLLALESELADSSTRLQFTCEGRLLRSLARVDRLDALAGKGNQRDEIKNHVERIAAGIRSGVQVPTAVLLVLIEGRTTVIQGGDDEDRPPESFIIVRPLSADWTTVGMAHSPDAIVQRFRYVEIDFPYRRAAFDEEKSSLLVDGQQRTAALSLVDIEHAPRVALSVNAVIADEEAAKAVFQIANSTQKIETQFARSLLASMQEAPGYLRSEQARAVAAKKLALSDKNSPFFQLVQYPGARRVPRPPVAYNSLFQVISVFAESALPIQDNSENLAFVTSRAFQLVKTCWPTAWGKKPSDSRLMHGIGLRATAALVASKLEQHFADYNELESEGLWQEVKDSLERLQSRIVWTDEEAAGASPAVKKTWREQIANRQNTNQDIAALTGFLKKESLSLDATKKAAKPAKV